MNRCILCDYTSEEGSEFAYRAPGTSSVREHFGPSGHGDFLCQECADATDENLDDLGVNDVDDD